MFFDFIETKRAFNSSYKFQKYVMIRARNRWRRGLLVSLLLPHLYFKRQFEVKATVLTTANRISEVFFFLFEILLITTPTNIGIMINVINLSGAFNE